MFSPPQGDHEDRPYVSPMGEKYFNHQEAEALLPLIGPFLEDARKQKQTVDGLASEIAKATSQIMLLGGSIPPCAELSQKKTEYDQTTARLEESVNKIQQMGCLVKDLDEGLVDFLCLLGGEEVYLCWKLGEERIGFWHGIDEGFAGRKPLDDSGSQEPPKDPRRVQ